MGLLAKDSKRISEIDQFAARCAASLAALYSSVTEMDRVEPGRAFGASIRQVMRMLAVLVGAQRAPGSARAAEPMRRASEALFAASEGAGTGKAYEQACEEIYASSGIGIFAIPEDERCAAELLEAMARGLLHPVDSPISPIYFQMMPLNWLGSAYQALLALKPSKSGEGLQASYRRRKEDGVYFTPPYLVEYIVESVVGAQAEDILHELGRRPPRERLARLKVLDPSVGGGDFLCAAIEHLARKAGNSGGGLDGFRARLAAECVYGVDVDGLVVEIARFCVWAASGFADGIAGSINAHILCGDVLGTDPECGPLEWSSAFPEVFSVSRGGFDAVVGNPPYIASKNRLAVGRSSSSASGQSDSYLRFLEEAVTGGLVRPGGMLSMVLPDPMLVRGNAAGIRRVLAEEWTMLSMLHLPGAFADAQVANVVPVCRNVARTAETFVASRIERAADRDSFARRPVQTARELGCPVRIATVLAQKRAEFVYLLEQEPFGGIIRRIHGSDMALGSYQPPFAPLEKLNIRAIYRGEEVGKAAITSEDGDYPMLLGGQSIKPYQIIWEGRRIKTSAIRKPVERYAGSKILVQKSSPRLIAALDRPVGEHPGYVFPQSVYGIELRAPGMDEFYLLCLLNSEVMNEYIHRTVTGYKFVHPQLEIEDIRRLPIRRIEFHTPHRARAGLAAKGWAVFENEASGAGSGGRFPELGNFVAECLAAAPERSDVVHDLLVRLGGLVSDLTLRNRESPSAQTTRRLESARAAIESVVWRLYSVDPLQMALPM